MESAKLHQLEVIPLVQTFGHLEHVLKLEEFVHLREVLNNPSTLCPTKNESFDLIQMMIDQVMALHQGYPIKFIHIGSDEVFQLGLCSKCRNRMKSEQKTSKHLFVGKYSSIVISSSTRELFEFRRTNYSVGCQSLYHLTNSICRIGCIYSRKV